MNGLVAVGFDLLESVMETVALLLKLMAYQNTFNSVEPYTKVFHLYSENLVDR